MAAQIIRFPKLPQALRCKSKTRAPAVAPLAEPQPRTRKGAAFRDATRRKLKAIIAHALEILDSLEREQEA